MKRHCLSAIAATAFAGLAVSAVQPAHGADAAGFYKGKTITFVTPGSAGGGYDTYMRTIIPYLEKKTGATAVPVNQPGGGHLLAVNRTYDAKPDGLTILLADGEATLVGQLLKVPGARYDLLKMNWLGRINGEKRLLLFTKKSPVNTFEALLKHGKPLKFGITGKTDSVGMATAFAAHALKIPVTLVTGYKGSREFVRAALQGEVDAIVLSESSSKRFSKGGRLIPGVTLSRGRSALFPDTPTIYEATKLSKEQAWWFDYHEAFAEVGRALVTTPGVPAERVAYLRKVFDEILHDKTLLAEMEKRRRPISYASAEDLEKSVKAVLQSVSGEKKKQVEHVLLEEFY